MLIEMHPGATEDAVQAVVARIEETGARAHVHDPGAGTTVVATALRCVDHAA